MNIAIDLRSLSSGTISGVENYTTNILNSLFGIDQKNHYTLFNNGFSKNSVGDFRYVNTSISQTGYPNKILNLALKLKLFKLEKIFGDFDVLFLPNLNQFNVDSKVKVVITVHDLSPVITPEFYNLKRRFWHLFLNYCKSFARANVLIAVSDHTKQDLIRIFGIKPEKIIVIYPGLDPNSLLENVSLEQQRFVRNFFGLPGEFILFLNTIEPRKNLSNLISGFEALKNNTHLVIAGRLGWKYKDIFRQIKKSKKSNKIKYIGYVDEKHKPSLIKLAKVLAYPSFYEGFGFQPLEASALGTPVLASQVTSMPEILRNSGLLVNPYSSEDITTGLIEILQKEDLRQKLILNAKLNLSRFQWSNSAKELLNIFNTLN